MKWSLRFTLETISYYKMYSDEHMNIDFTKPKFLKQIIKTPENIIDQLDLVYVNDDKLTITRSRYKKGFRYFLNGRLLSSKKDI